MGLKATGCYLSRALSYRGADFALAPVTIDPVFRHVSGYFPSQCPVLAATATICRLVLWASQVVQLGCLR